jgi:hypothetical protein
MHKLSNNVIYIFRFMGESLTELEIQLIIGKKDNLTMHSTINQYRPYSLFSIFRISRKCAKAFVYQMSSFLCEKTDEADKDNDGVIDYAEFFGMMTPGGKLS